MPIARDLAALGFKLVATRGTAAYLRAHGLEVEVVYKINEGRPHVGDRIVNRQIQLVLNTPLGRESFFDDRSVRRVGDDAGRAVHHHADRWRGYRQRDQGPARAGARRPLAAGVPRDGHDDGSLTNANVAMPRYRW